MTREERQEAIAQLERISRNLASIGETVDYTEFAIEALEQEPRWIPVSERLPEEETYVLTTIYIPGRQPHARSGCYQYGFFHNDNGDVWRATDREVTAWMPLPKPYKPQESEEV